MPRTLFGALLGIVLVLGLIAAPGSSEPTTAAPGISAPYPTASNLITHVLPAEGGTPAIVVVDPNLRVLAVYHVDKTTGEIGLRSVRNITWDLQLLEFNSGKPLPQDIRNLHGELKQ